MVIPVPKKGYNNNFEKQRPSCAHFKFLSSHPPVNSKSIYLGYSIMKFTGNDDGPTIEEFIAFLKEQYSNIWRIGICLCLQDDACRWWESLNKDKFWTLLDEDYETFLLDRWSSTRSTNKEIHKDILQKDNVSFNGLPSCNNSLLQVQGCLQQEHVIISISHNCMHDFINSKLAKSLMLLARNVCSTHIDGEHAQMFTDLKIIMGNYVLDFDFQARDMDNMDIVLVYPWMKSMGTINLNL